MRWSKPGRCSSRRPSGSPRAAARLQPRSPDSPPAVLKLERGVVDVLDLDLALTQCAPPLSAMWALPLARVRSQAPARERASLWTSRNWTPLHAAVRRRRQRATHSGFVFGELLQLRLRQYFGVRARPSALDARGRRRGRCPWRTRTPSSPGARAAPRRPRPVRPRSRSTDMWNSVGGARATSLYQRRARRPCRRSVSCRRGRALHDRDRRRRRRRRSPRRRGRSAGRARPRPGSKSSSRSSVRGSGIACRWASTMKLPLSVITCARAASSRRTSATCLPW